MRAAGTGARWRPVEADGGGAVWGGMLKRGVRPSIPRTRAGRNQAAGRLVRRLRLSLGPAAAAGDIEVILELGGRGRALQPSDKRAGGRSR